MVWIEAWPRRDLDLLERRPAEVGELGEGAPQVVRRDPDADPEPIGGDGLEDRLRPQRTGPDAAALRDAAQHGSGGYSGGGGPAIESRLGPGGHRGRCGRGRACRRDRRSPSGPRVARSRRSRGPRARRGGAPSPRAAPAGRGHAGLFGWPGRGRRAVAGLAAASASCRSRTPVRRAPETRKMAAAASGESSSFEAASVASLRSAASARLIEAADSLRSARCER